MSSAKRLAFYARLQVGDEVYWNDPDEGLASGFGKIVSFEMADGQTEVDDDTVIWLQMNSGSDAQVYAMELA